MKKVRLSASVDADLVAAAEASVAGGRLDSVSAWVNEALRSKAEEDRRLDAMGAFIAAYEKEFGKITEDDMRAAEDYVRRNTIEVRSGKVQSRTGTRKRERSNGR